MNPLVSFYDRGAASLDAAAPVLLPTLSRLLFAGVLLGYFWASGLTKFEGLFTPSTGAYAQIFPRLFEAVGYDATQLGPWPKLVVIAGAYGEMILPLLVVAGLLTRAAALGMIGFILVQSVTDIIGHGADVTTVGTWFDRIPDAMILDQRALWLLPLIVLVAMGSGPFSVDRVLRGLRKNQPKPLGQRPLSL